MADGGSRRRVRRLHDISDVNYGHFAEPTYNVRSAAWNFTRSTAEEGAVNQNDEQDEHGPLQLLHHRVLDKPDQASEKIGAIEGPGSYKVKRLLKWYPELVPAAKVIKEIVNEPQNEAPSDEALVCNQLVWAEARQPELRADYRAEAHLSVLISVADDNNSTLEFRVVRLQEVSLLDTRITDMPMCSNYSTWSAPSNGPILQLCYGYAHSLLAYRQSFATTVCLVFAERRSQRTEDQRKITFNPVLTLPIDQTGGQPHAHIALNLSKPTLLGVVDTHGNWSIWQITGKPSRTIRLLYQAKLLSSAKLWAWSEENRPRRGSNPYFDGWHRICFVQVQDSTRAFLVLNRRSAVLYDSDGIELEIVSLRLEQPDDRVLDAQMSLTDASICVVLTSSKVLLVRTEVRYGMNPSAMLVCSVNHLLGNQSLHMSLLNLPRMVRVFIYGPSSSLLTLSSFKNNYTEMKWHATQPQRFESLSEQEHFPSATDLTLLSFASPERRRKEKKEDEGDDEEEDTYVVISAIWKCTTGHIRETIYKVAYPQAADDVTTDSLLRPWPKSQRKYPLSSSVIDDDEEEEIDYFIVEDADQQFAPNRPVCQRIARGRPGNAIKNWSWLLTPVEQVESRSTINEGFDQIQQSLLAERSAFSSLIDIVPGLRIDDVEEAEQFLQGWFSRHSNDTIRYSTKHARPDGFSATYAQINEDFGVALSENVSDRTRVTTERLSRQLGMDIMLSSLIWEQNDTSPKQQQVSKDAEEGPSGYGDFALNAARSRLSKYTICSDTNQAAASSETHVADLLAHLPDDINTFPGNYSYADVELGLARQKLQAQELDPVARRRAERIEAARNRRAEKARVAAKLNLSQETPVLLRSSSPLADLRGMTQPERGPHAIRPLKALRPAKKKQKTAGF